MTHPAIHPERISDDRVPTPLFERAGQEVEPSHSRSHYVIEAGDSLWKVAQRELGTDDPTAIHIYWERIFEANRTALGPDPDLIFAGQRIKLPAHKD